MNGKEWGEGVEMMGKRVGKRSGNDGKKSGEKEWE